MIKHLQELWGRLGRNRGRRQATVQVDFFRNKAACAALAWEDNLQNEHDTVSLAIFLYARILFELAEINETRVANELMAFLAQVVDLVLTEDGAPHRPRLPLGELTLPTEAPSESPHRSYRGDFYQQQDGQYRMDFEGTLGKEGVYLPATYVVFLQDCLNTLNDESLRRLARSLARLHDYYKFRKDFWDGTALAAGPVFALSSAKVGPEEMSLEEVTSKQ
jgi:hypothetical protein